MLLIGALPQPITSAPLVLFIYFVLILMLVSAIATVFLRSTLYAIGAFAATMGLVSLLYLSIAPFLLFALQLLVFTTVSAALLIGLLRDTTGFRASTVGPFSRVWIIGAAVSAALLALLALVLGVTAWPVRVCCASAESFGATLTNLYTVGLAVLAVIVATSALGSGLLLAAPRLAGRTHRGEPAPPARGGRRPGGTRR